MKAFRNALFPSVGAALCALGLIGAAAPAAAQTWPDRTVRLISPYGAGGSNDISARILGEALGKRLAQQFIVENKPGAGTRIANEMLARAAPDGYTVLYAAAPYAVAESMYGKLSYDPHKDIKPVSMAVIGSLFLIVNANSPFKTVNEFIAYGKSQAKGLTLASPGAGSGPHLTGELLFREAGVKGLTVHFRGDATAYTELLAGRVDATLTAITSALPHIQSGKLRVLAVASEERSPIYPSAPTFQEAAGLSKVIGYGWFGFMVPAATPQAIVDRLHDEVKTVLADTTIRQRLAGLGLQPRSSTPAEFAAFIDKESTRWAEIIKAAGIKGD